MQEKMEIQQDVENKHRREKEKQKNYADQKRKTTPHEIKPGDTVLVRQPRENKFSLPYDPVPYTVEKVKGSMITADRYGGRKSITRNSSHFKRLKIPADGIVNDVEDDPEELDDRAVAVQDKLSVNSDELSINPEQGAVPVVVDTPEVIPNARPKRDARKLVWLKDYVTHIRM